MARITKCDICGQEFLEPFGFARLHGELLDAFNTSNAGTYDLCHECFEKVRNFIKEEHNRGQCTVQDNATDGS